MDRQLSLLHKTPLPFLLLLFLLLLASSSDQQASSTPPPEGSAWSPHVYIIDQPPPAAGSPLSMATSPPASQNVTLIFVVGMIICVAIFSVTYFIAYRTIFVTRRELWNPNYTYRSRRRRSSNGEAPPQEYGSEDGQGGSSTGLAASLMSSFPIIKYSSAMAMKEMAQHTQIVVTKECAVCLSEYAEGEDMKLLPVCGHSFHRACIDMWLFSHTTCPVCRLSLLVKQAADKDAPDRTPPSASTDPLALSPH